MREQAAAMGYVPCASCSRSTFAPLDGCRDDVHRYTEYFASIGATEEEI